MAKQLHAVLDDGTTIDINDERLDWSGFMPDGRRVVKLPNGKIKTRMV